MIVQAKVACGTHLSLDCSTEGQFTAGTDGKFWFSLRGQAQPSPQDQSWGHQEVTTALTQLPALAQEGKVLVSGNPPRGKPKGFSLGAQGLCSHEVSVPAL